MFGNIIAGFQVINKLGRAQFFQKSFLLANITIKVVLEMLFLIFSNVNIQFAEKKPTWRSYTTEKALLIAEKVTVPIEYSDFANVFSKESAKVLLKRIGINEHAVKLEKCKQPSYRPIYSLGPIELKTLKTYIETNMANSFIRPSKFPVGAPILFVCKPNNSFWLCVDYRGLNNLIIKNKYSFPLISESLNWLE